MSSFKDAVAADIKTVFINTDEFADVHELNGVGVPMVIDTSIISEAKATIASPLEGVFLNTKTLYVSAEDLGISPVEGEIITLDGAMHLVKSVSLEQGVLVIVIEANEQ
jgi:hypothetical protein